MATGTNYTYDVISYPIDQYPPGYAVERQQTINRQMVMTIQSTGSSTISVSMAPHVHISVPEDTREYYDNGDVEHALGGGDNVDFAPVTATCQANSFNGSKEGYYGGNLRYAEGYIITGTLQGDTLTGTYKWWIRRTSHEDTEYWVWGEPSCLEDIVFTFSLNRTSP